MIADALGWLLEPRDPPVRLNILTDILQLPWDSKEVASTRKRVLSCGLVRRILNGQRGLGYWPPENTCYRPKFTATVWPLILLGEMGVPAEPHIKTACERFFSLHQMSNGAFSCPSRREMEKRGVSKREEEPCLTGNMIRTLIVFGYGEDPRVLKAVDWMPEHQQEDGGWNCDYPLRKVTHSSFMQNVRSYELKRSFLRPTGNHEAQGDSVCRWGKQVWPWRFITNLERGPG